MKQYRQGEVYLRRIDGVPSGLKEKDKILAHGEATGHKHKFTSEHAHVFSNAGSHQFVILDEPCILEHEDHANIEIPKGEYEVIIQREYDIVEGVRQVMD